MSTGENECMARTFDGHTHGSLSHTSHQPSTLSECKLGDLTAKPFLKLYLLDQEGEMDELEMSSCSCKCKTLTQSTPH